jgi:regulation of enolase protein 1 (concanavalin A-like superfamily)
MHRLAVALLPGALAAVTAWAAPAPQPRCWVVGWDRPVDPRGGCRFHPVAGTLTVTAPGKGHDLDVLNGRLNAPRLLRGVQGEFTAQVRVGALVRPAGRGCYRAGLLLTDGKAFVTVQRVARAEEVPEDYPPSALPGVIRTELSEADWGQVQVYADGPALAVPAYLRVQRRGDSLMVAFSRDGKKWTRTDRTLRASLPQKLKVGVIAESTAEGTFRATFDRFKLTPLRK